RSRTSAAAIAAVGVVCAGYEEGECLIHAVSGPRADRCWRTRTRKDVPRHLPLSMWQQQVRLVQGQLEEELRTGSQPVTSSEPPATAPASSASRRFCARA